MLAAFLTTAMLAVTATSAQAALIFPFEGQLTSTGASFGSFSSNSVAVDTANGNTYIASEPDSVAVFETATRAQLAALDGGATPSRTFGGGRISVAASDTSGEVFVLDTVDGVVDVFGPTGSFACQISGKTPLSPEEKAAECNGVAGSETPSGGLHEPGAIAVDQTSGEVFVLDANDGAVDVFSEGGEYLRRIDLSAVPGGIFAPLTRAIAVSGANGHVYLGAFNEAGAVSELLEFDAAGNYVATWLGTNTPAAEFGGELSVAVDDTSGDVFVSDSFFGETDVFDAAGNYLAQFSHEYHSAQGTAVDQQSRSILVSDGGESPAIDIFHAALVVPNVSVAAPASVEATSAELEGIVNPDSTTLTGCHFELVSQAQFETNGFAGAGEPTCVPAAAAIPADSNPHPVTATVTGLSAGTGYRFRLSASNASGQNMSTEETFSTPPPPMIEAAFATDTETGAELDAEINPQGFETEYRFEYGTSAAYGTDVPIPDEAIGSGNSPVPVSRPLTGLATDVTYHWRVVAHNVNGTTASPDHTFIFLTATPPSGSCANEAHRAEQGLAGLSLPDCRAYEMVTPLGKNGAAIGSGFPGLIGSPDIAIDGSRLMISSIQCFAGPASCTATRQSEGEPYEFSSGPGGWTTTPLAPPPLAADANSSWLVSASDGSALLSIPNQTSGEDDFVVRRADGSFQQIGAATPPARGAVGPVFGSSLILATPDFSHLVFELPKTTLWPFDSSIGAQIYEYAGAADKPLLVGVKGGPGSDEVISSCGTLSAGGVRSALSGDGATLYFEAQGHDLGESFCPSGATAPPVTRLYARVDGETPAAHTVAISDPSPSECGSGSEPQELACRNSAPADARFDGASLNGSLAYFSDTQQLTDNASQDPNPGDSAAAGCQNTSGPGGCNLYLYNLKAAAGHHLIAVSAGDNSGFGPRVQRVLAISADGSHVYFVAKGVLSEVPNDQGQSAFAGGENLYVFERDAAAGQGQVTFIAALPGFQRSGGSIRSGNRPSVTPDGRYLLFTSYGDLTADDSSGTTAAQAFRYDAAIGDLVRVSIGDRGFNDNGNLSGGCTLTTEGCVLDATIALPTNVLRRDPSMSDDGSRVFFQSPVGLTPRAQNLDRIATNNNGDPVFAQNVYEWESPGAGGCARGEGCISLISDGRDTSETTNQSSVQLLGTDASGENVFFRTASALAPQDTDTQVDYYDARHLGGFAAPASAPTCEGDECKSPGTAASPTAAPATANFFGSEKPPKKPHHKHKKKKHRKSHKKRNRKQGRDSKRTQTSPRRGDGK